ncbi:PEPxxWA-CTERM sorting domain-containing protein [Polymorphobacter arshaanensis]|nr:PEPxxWA-CTERM sorting domain-containing protein [Polymorphobacter arshaanensis]
MNKHSIGGAVALAAVSIFATAAQAVTWSSVPGAPDPGPAPGQTMLVSFDTPLPTGYALSGDYGIVSGSSGAAATPATDTSKYFYVSSALGSGIAKLTTPSLKSVSFYWGSVDNYNFVDVLGAGGTTLFTLAGSSLPAANGNQFISSTNRRVSFDAGAGEAITGLRFRSTGVAFELDSIAGAAVPEPASWMLMIIGFGMIGAASRRRAKPTLAHVSA